MGDKKDLRTMKKGSKVDRNSSTKFKHNALKLFSNDNFVDFIEKLDKL